MDPKNGKFSFFGSHLLMQEASHLAGDDSVDQARRCRELERAWRLGVHCVRIGRTVSSVPRLSRRVRSVLVAVDARCELQLVDWPRAWPSSRRPCRPSSVPPGRPWTCRSGRGEWYDIRDSFADSFDMRFLRRTLTRVRRIYLRR